MSNPAAAHLAHTPLSTSLSTQPSTPVERRLAVAAGAYTALGLLAGLFARTLTHGHDFTGPPQLWLGHTHLLALGMLVMLAVLVLERLFRLSDAKVFRWFEPTYHAGMVVTVGVLLVRGTLQVVATNPTSAAVAGIAGLGHILLSIGLLVLMLALRSVLRAGR